MRWLKIEAVLAAHQMQIREHGGAPGIRDQALLESALARPRNKSEYEDASVFQCAAALAHGLVKNHPFVDGNKRIALLATFMFLKINGYTFGDDSPETYSMVVALAGGKMTEAEFATWLARKFPDPKPLKRPPAGVGGAARSGGSRR
jgi:death on curing protein